eukprot:3858744-Pyramimonas_sp.AAC.1
MCIRDRQEGRVWVSRRGKSILLQNAPNVSHRTARSSSGETALGRTALRGRLERDLSQYAVSH